MPDFGNLDTIGQWAGAHGPLALGVAALLCALGVPVPVPILLLAFAALSHGAPSRLGLGMLACFLGALLGESLHFALGKTAGSWLRDRMQGRWRQAWTLAEHLLKQYSGAAVALSRSVLGAIGLPIDWISGSSGFNYWRFAIAAVVGDGTWILRVRRCRLLVGRKLAAIPRRAAKGDRRDRQRTRAGLFCGPSCSETC